MHHTGGTVIIVNYIDINRHFLSYKLTVFVYYILLLTIIYNEIQRIQQFLSVYNHDQDFIDGQLLSFHI